MRKSQSSRPSGALWLSGKLSMTQEEEVLDIDEEQYRKEHINTRLYGI